MTIREIASLANTSRGTVDRVLNGRGNVSPDVRKRIEKVLSDTGYVFQMHTKQKGVRTTFEVAAIVANRNNNFFDLVLQGRKNALLGEYRYSGIVLKVYPVSLFNDQEVRDALNSLSKKTKLLIISAAGNEKIVEKIDSFKIPVISESIDIHAKYKIGYVGCDFYNSGALAADRVNLLIKPGEKVQVLIGSYSHQGHRQRLEGFKQALSPSFESLAPIETYDDDKIGYEKTKDCIRNKKPDILVYFGAGRVGGLKAVEEEKVHRPKVITVDEIPEILLGLKNGLVSASISQHPYQQGKKCIEIAYRHLLLNEKKCKDIHVVNSVRLKDTIVPYGTKEDKQ